MKVLLVHNTYQDQGGEDVVLRQERELLTAAGHDVSEYLRHNSEIKQYSVAQRLTLIGRTVWAFDSQREFRELVLHRKPDIVHVHNTFPLISPSVYNVCEEAKVPVVQTLHNYRLFCSGANFFRDGRVCEECIDGHFWRGVRHGCYRDSPLQTAPVALMLSLHHARKTWFRKVDRYIALTSFARGRFVKAGMPAEKIVVKPNFVPDPGKRSGGEGSYAVCVGRVSQEKGVPTLLKAWRVLGQAIPLQVIGVGPARELLEREAAADGLSHVKFLGQQPRDQVIAAMKGARFVIFPSELYENFPLTILEAFACGVPVVASRLGAMQEIVEDGRTGMFFGPGNAQELADVVARAWQQPEYMKLLGEQARKEYEINYTAAANYGRLMEIYQEVIAARTAEAEPLRVPLQVPVSEEVPRA